MNLRHGDTHRSAAKGGMPSLAIERVAPWELIPAVAFSMSGHLERGFWQPFSLDLDL
jgi:hypothetical protein